MADGKPRRGHPRFYELVQEITDLHDRKNTDYAAGTKEGPLGNFERVSVIMKLYPGLDWDSPFGVACVQMLKQLDAAFTLRSQKRESITGEGIASRLRDVTVFALIEQILVEEEGRRAIQNQRPIRTQEEYENWANNPPHQPGVFVPFCGCRCSTCEAARTKS